MRLSSLSDESELASVIRRDWSVEPSDVLDLLAGRTSSPGQRLLRSIISGPIDIDKMDYLDRDSLHCGVPYGRNFDRQRLMQSLILNETGDALAITYKGKTAAELMVFARYVMFGEVYWHHAVRSATSMFARSFFELHDRIKIDGLFRLTEAEMIGELRSVAGNTDCERLLEGVFGPRRRLYKRVIEYTHSDDSPVYERLARRPFADLVTFGDHLCELASQRLGRTISRGGILIDGPPPHREVEFDIDVYFPSRQKYARLRDVSPVVEALARTQFDESVKRVRIFADPTFAEDLAGLSDWNDIVLAAIR